MSDRLAGVLTGLVLAAAAVAACAVAGCKPSGRPAIRETTAPASAPASDLQQKAMAILKNRCAECHNWAAKPDAASVLVSTRRVKPGDAAGSRLYRQVSGGKHPPEGATNGRPTPEELTAIKDWINSLAPAKTSAPAKPAAAGWTNTSA